MTLTTYEQLKAYWFNPGNKKVMMILRNLKPLADPRVTQSLLNKLELARGRLHG